MSVFKPTGTATYWFKFQRGGRTFQGSTQETDKTRAKAIERAEKIKAEQQLRAERDTGRRPMTVDRCFALYADEVLAHRPSGDQRVVLLHWLEDQLGADKTLADLTNTDIAEVIKARRACKKRSGRDDKGRSLFKPVSVATVNRTIECLRSALYYARDNHSAMLGSIKLKKIPGEPKHRTREATLGEEAAIFAMLREDFRDVARFAMLTGIRFNGCVSLRWSFIDFDARTLRYVKKRNPGGAPEWGVLPMSPEVEAILRQQVGRHRSHVWTYVATGRKRGGKGDGERRAGERYPITFAGLQTRWKRALAKAGVVDFRFHDLRHTAATRLRRNGADLVVVKELLGHASIATTAKYSHVTQADLRVAMERSERAQEAARHESSHPDPQGFPQGLPKLKVVE